MLERESAIQVNLENRELRACLGELSVAVLRNQEYIDIFGKPPPKRTKLSKDLHAALSAATTLLGGEMTDAC